jgi:hypothetical protein
MHNTYRRGAEDAEGGEWVVPSNWAGYQKHEAASPKGVTPECLNRGSSSCLAWISARGRIRPKSCGGPAKSMRE